MKKNTKIINDNRKQLNSIVSKVYNDIFKLETNLLQEHELAVFKELISRKDYVEISHLIDKYNIIQDELLRRGYEIKNV